MTAPRQSVAAWEPIETAPRDGTELLLWFPYTGPYADRMRGKGNMFHALWFECDTGPEAWRDPYDYELVGDDATHWHPMPSPPEPSP